MITVFGSINIDLIVAVDEIEADASRQQPSDRGLPRTHEADEGDPCGQTQRPAPRSSSPKNMGREIETTSAPEISVSPKAQSAATERAMAMRWSP